jgi:hypothetical protein
MNHPVSKFILAPCLSLYFSHSTHLTYLPASHSNQLGKLSDVACDKCIQHHHFRPCGVFHSVSSPSQTFVAPPLTSWSWSRHDPKSGLFVCRRGHSIRLGRSHCFRCNKLSLDGSRYTYLGSSGPGGRAYRENFRRWGSDLYVHCSSKFPDVCLVLKLFRWLLGTVLWFGAPGLSINGDFWQSWCPEFQCYLCCSVSLSSLSVVQWLDGLWLSLLQSLISSILSALTAPFLAVSKSAPGRLSLCGGYPLWPT